MKAAFQNLVRYLLCMASVVLAAPNQSTLYPQPRNKGGVSTFSIPRSVDRPVFTQAKQGVKRDASILEGSTRFELW
ncbi:hypothetical protein [Sediminibacterium sp.]|uniref:hypothetical protein n=1 Tax=Sediminibacterium sp. TaxID=1917865 RepID=UPI0025F5361D|nr:hypothetical protein [Sediminibacterium sp.]MBW0176927.1 hypothetical protein [Sediminibacterium sp.]